MCSDRTPRLGLLRTGVPCGGIRAVKISLVVLLVTALAQGYFISRPVPAAELEHLLSNQSGPDMAGRPAAIPEGLADEVSKDPPG